MLLDAFDNRIEGSFDVLLDFLEFLLSLFMLGMSLLQVHRMKSHLGEFLLGFGDILVAYTQTPFLGLDFARHRRLIFLRRRHTCIAALACLLIRTIATIYN